MAIGASPAVRTRPVSSVKVRKNRRVVFHYEVFLANGELFDASLPDSPVCILCGRGDTIPGVEKRMLGMEPGETREFVVPPSEAFGPYDTALIRRIPRARVPEEFEVRAGRCIPLPYRGTEVMARVVSVDGDTVLVDMNHPLAGHPVHYRVTVVEVEEPGADPFV